MIDTIRIVRDGRVVEQRCLLVIYKNIGLDVRADSMIAALQFLNGRAAEPGCIDCTGVATPSCPSCPSGQTCVQSIQTCNSCVTTTCQAVAGTGTSSSGSTGSSSTSTDGGLNVGAIVGGVIGGVIAIAALVYLTWRFCVKNKRQQYQQEDWVEFQHEPTDAEKDFSFRRDQRASTHTMGSIASTVLTRASNIIQIAYIPGMTSRSTPSTPGLLVPPVPPIPLALAPQSSPAYTDEHFFMPGDLRDSTYSAMTSMTDRTSYAPRSSVASTIYGKNAVVSPVNPQMIVRGKAAVVSVKSAGNSTPGSMTPPVPAIDFERFADNRGPPSPAFSVGSTFLNSASAATQARPQIVRLGSATKIDTTAPAKVAETKTMTRDSAAVTIIDDSPEVEQGPFADPPAGSTASTPESSPTKSKRSSLSAVIEEATRKAMVVGKREKSPFSDEHSADK